MLRAFAARLFDFCAALLPASSRYKLSRRLAASLPAQEQYRLGQVSMAAGLMQLARNGFAPRWIVDVGAHKGEWTALAAQIFPQAQLLMVEADPQWDAQLRRVADALPGRARAVVTLLGPEARSDVLFYSMGMGSSVLEELTSAAREHKHLPMQTLDALLAEHGVGGGAMLLKLDVQGYELEVLRGGQKALAAADVLVAELSLLEYNRGAPLLPEVVSYLDQRGLVPYDFAGMVRRWEDAALFQLDVVFARKEHPLRAPKKFWPDV